MFILIYLRFILIFSSQLCLGLFRDLLPFAVAVKILKVLIFSHFGYMSCPPKSFRFNRLDHRRYLLKLRSSYSQSLLGWNIYHMISSSNSFNLLLTQETMFHSQCTTICHVIVLYIFIFRFLEGNREDKNVGTDRHVKMTLRAGCLRN